MPDSILASGQPDADLVAALDVATVAALVPALVPGLVPPWRFSSPLSGVVEVVGGAGLFVVHARC